METIDFMTAHWAHLPYELLGKVSQPHHQRGARHQPRRLRHLRQAAGDDRVGITLLGASLAEAATKFAARPAMTGMSYAEFLEAAQSVRATLTAAGLKANEPVHVRVSNQPLDLAAYLGVWLAGGVVVPVHRTSPDGAVAHMIAKTRARFEWDGMLRRQGGEPPPARAVLEDAAFVVFTSGSSGMPKGAVLSHRAFAGKLAAIQSLLHFGEGERTLLVLNITFSFGIWVASLRSCTAACSFRAKDSPHRRSSPTSDHHARRGGADDDAQPDPRRAQANSMSRELRQVLIGGETLGKGLGETLRELFSPADLIDIYGLTETSTCDFFLMPQTSRVMPAASGARRLA